MEVMDKKQILINARQIIKKQKHWCKNSSAISKIGAVVEVDDPSAYAFCASGCVKRAMINASPALRNLYKLYKKPEFFKPGSKEEAQQNFYIGIFKEVTELLYSNLSDEDRDYFDRIWRWQDDFDRSHGEVLALFDKTIEGLQSAC